MRRHLGIDFSSILVDFGGQVGPKLAPKTQQKWIPKTIKKLSPKKSVLKPAKTVSWRLRTAQEAARGASTFGPVYIYGHSWLPPPEPPSLSSEKTDDGLKALLQAALRSYLPRFPPYIYIYWTPRNKMVAR